MRHDYFIPILATVVLIALVLPVKGDPVVYFSFDNITGDTVADLSGSGNDGTREDGPTVVDGQFGQALEFENSRVAILASDSLTADLFQGSFTLVAWINAKRAGDTWQQIFRAIRADAGSNDTLFINNDGRLSWRGRVAGGWAGGMCETSPGIVSADQWTHVAVTGDGASFRIYVNGALTQTSAFQRTDGSNATYYVGGDPTWVGESFSGAVDEFGVFAEVIDEAEIQAAMTDGLSPKEIAAKPSPENESMDVLRDTLLAWAPGAFAQSHDVYLGTVFDDVNTADVSNPNAVLVQQGHGETTLNPGRLEFGQTYYWRIDEVNGAPDFTVYRGKVWSFSVEPTGYPITGITAMASGSFGDSGPENTINGSGMVDDFHGVSASDMWISSGVPATIEYAFDRAYKLHELWIWNSNQLIETFVGFGAKDVVIEHSLDGANWTALDGVSQLAQAPGADGYAHNNTIAFGGITAQHVRITINSLQGIAPQASLSEVRFFYVPTFATRPNPADGASGVAPDTLLSWGRNGREADRHEVYVGVDADNLVSAGGTTDMSIETLALDLQLGESYTWRVDEVNETVDPSTWEGTVWRFTTVDAIVIDDMESYADEEFKEIWATWVDGFEDPANGSLVGNGAAGTPETVIVDGGSQSLPLHFDNSTASASEATRTFDAPMDWTKHGIQSLALSFSRGAKNTGNGQLYVKVNDTKVVYPEDPGTLPPGWDAWTQWNIDLTTVGTNLTSVRSLTVGIEGAGARGVLYVDDIQLVDAASESGSQQLLTWFEAESGTITTPLQVFNDPTASAGQHIGTEDGIGDENDNPPADGVATYSITVPEDGVYRLAIRVIITGGSNSFWIQIPGMATNTTNHASGWVRFNDISDGDTWHWDEVHSSDDSNQVVEFTLSAGTHTLEIVRREDGALLDAIAVIQVIQ